MQKEAKYAALPELCVKLACLESNPATKGKHFGGKNNKGCLALLSSWSTTVPQGTFL